MNIRDPIDLTLKFRHDGERFDECATPRGDAFRPYEYVDS